MVESGCPDAMWGTKHAAWKVIIKIVIMIFPFGMELHNLSAYALSAF